MFKQLIYSNGKDEIRIGCPKDQVQYKQKMFSKLKEYKSYKIIDIIDMDETPLYVTIPPLKKLINHFWD